MDSAFQPQIILLREGTDSSQGKSQIISNINACQAVAETVRTTLGPRGMDKLVFDGQRTTISNDGATIMRLLDIVHPAAKTLVDISMAQVMKQIITSKITFSCRSMWREYSRNQFFHSIALGRRGR